MAARAPRNLLLFRGPGRAVRAEMNERHPHRADARTGRVARAVGRSRGWVARLTGILRRLSEATDSAQRLLIEDEAFLGPALFGEHGGKRVP